MRRHAKGDAPVITLYTDNYIGTVDPAEGIERLAMDTIASIRLCSGGYAMPLDLAQDELTGVYTPVAIGAQPPKVFLELCFRPRENYFDGHKSAQFPKGILGEVFQPPLVVYSGYDPERRGSTTVRRRYQVVRGAGPRPGQGH